MLASSNGSGEDRTVLICMIALGICALFVGLYSAVEVHLTLFGPSGSYRDAETTGTTVRKSFLLVISLASFARVASVAELAVYYYQLVNVNMDKPYEPDYSRTMEMARFLPTCLYLSVYTMVTVYFAQMCYTVSVSSLSFFQLRGVFILGNVLSYGFVIFFVGVVPVESIVYLVFLVSYSVILSSTLFYGYSLFKLLPGSTAHHQLTARRVMARFVPLLMICTAGLILGTVYYLCLVLGVLSTYPATTRLLASRQFIQNFVAFTFTEVIPSMLIILLISKKSNNNSTAAAGEGNTLIADTNETNGDLLHIIKTYISGKYNSIPASDTAVAVARV
jgi:hypothetical protein